MVRCKLKKFYNWPLRRKEVKIRLKMLSLTVIHSVTLPDNYIIEKKVKRTKYTLWQFKWSKFSPVRVHTSQANYYHGNLHQNHLFHINLLIV